MGLGQTLLTIMALMLMGRLILMVNTSTLDTGFTKDMAEYRITATSLGTSLLESANNFAYDEATVDTFLTPSQASSLTAESDFGPDAGETDVSLFDDVDDFDEYTKIDTLSNSAIFQIHGQVDYLEISGSVMSITTSKKFNKLITIYVTSDYLVDYSVDPPRPDTLKFESVFSYWYFR